MEGIKRRFTVTANVIRELSDDVNAGLAFLQWVGKATRSIPNLAIHGDGVSLQIGGDKAELVNTVYKSDGNPSLELGPDMEDPRQEMGPDVQGRTQEYQGRDPKREESRGTRPVELSIFAQSSLRLKPNTLNFIKVPEMKGTAMVEPVAQDHECKMLPAVYRATC